MLLIRALFGFIEAMTIHWILSSDHRGVELRKFLAEWLTSKGHNVQDIGPRDSTRCDAPVNMDAVVEEMQKAKDAKGLFICGTGGNPSVRANRYPGIRAVLATKPLQAQFGVEHGQANVLCMGADVIAPATAIAILTSFINAEFIDSDPSYQRRIDQLDAPLKGDF